jgi:hypothetical protein
MEYSALAEKPSRPDESSLNIFFFADFSFSLSLPHPPQLAHLPLPSTTSQLLHSSSHLYQIITVCITTSCPFFQSCS